VSSGADSWLLFPMTTPSPTTTITAPTTTIAPERKRRLMENQFAGAFKEDASAHVELSRLKHRGATDATRRTQKRHGPTCPNAKMHKDE
jgi:hypothetical protein